MSQVNVPNSSSKSDVINQAPRTANSFPSNTTPEPMPCATPQISIIMPVYREQPHILTRTLQSISAQTFTDYELIVVVDNPANSEAIALIQDIAARDPRVRYVINEQNLGVWPSYNRGISLARGSYLAIQDADDESLPLRLETTHAFLVAHPEIDVVGTAIEYVSESDRSTLLTRYYSPEVSREIKRFCPLAHGTTLRKRILHERFGGYDESSAVKHAADYELWIRWYLQGVRFANLPDVLYKYYQSDVNFKNLHARRILEDTITIKRRHVKQLNFSLLDHLHLMAERVAATLPAWAITGLFYQYNSWRARRARPS